MGKQMSGPRSDTRRWLILLPILWVMLACRFLSGPQDVPAQAVPGPTDEPTADLQASPDSPGAVTESVPDGPDPLERLFDLRSIQFQWTARQPAGTAQTVQGEIDGAGNMHLTFRSPVPALSGIPKDFDRDLKLPEEYEVYVVAGKSYQPDDRNPAWMTAPAPGDYVKELSVLLHGSNGPGLWLDLLPGGSLRPAGQETVGGFAADKYTVNGMVHDQAITGALWYASHVLVRVELHIPAALADPNRAGAKGELEITLEVRKADVPSVVLPAAAPTSQP